MFNLTDEEKDHLLGEIRAFHVDVLDEDITPLREQQILDFICETAAPIVYNRALDDAQKWFKTQLENVELDYSLLYRDV